MSDTDKAERERIGAMVEGREYVTTSAILSAVNAANVAQNQRRAARLMRSLGWVKRRARVPGQGSRLAYLWRPAQAWKALAIGADADGWARVVSDSQCSTEKAEQSQGQ